MEIFCPLLSQKTRNIFYCSTHLGIFIDLSSIVATIEIFIGSQLNAFYVAQLQFNSLSIAQPELGPTVLHYQSELGPVQLLTKFGRLFEWTLQA